MKYKFINIIFVFFFLFTNNSHSENQILILDIDYVINNSLAGKSIILQIENQQKKLIEEYKKKEEELKSEEVQLVSQKNILDDEQFKKKAEIFRTKVDKFNLEKSKSANNLKQKQIKAQSTLSQEIIKIVGKFAAGKSAPIILHKHSIIIGKTEFEITREIMDLLNKKLKTIKF